MSSGDCGPRRRARPPSSPRGVTSLDLATGIGGLPRGAVIELVGVESSGKTAILYAALAAAQADDGLVALIDAEGTADGETLLACGVDLDALIIAYPASAPDAFLLLTILARCRALDLLALVSIPALRDLPPGTAIPARDASGDRPPDLAAPDPSPAGGARPPRPGPGAPRQPDGRRGRQRACVRRRVAARPPRHIRAVARRAGAQATTSRCGFWPSRSRASRTAPGARAGCAWR